MSDGRPLRIALASFAEKPEGEGGEGLVSAALAERGACPEWVVWNDPAVDWSGYDLIVIRCTWDYPDRLDAFRAWVNAPAVATRVVNPPNLVLANLHKGYLADMGDIAVPTVVIPAGMTVDLGLLRWPQVVVKPAVGVGGIGAVRAATQADLERLTLAPSGAVDAIVQPYLASVEDYGEVSVVCIEGEPSHAVHKLPAAGEFRIHDHWGGTAEPVELAAADVAVARAALGTLHSTPAYARVDLIHDGERPRVIELELIEPYLWFELAPHAAGRLADTVLRRARHR
ncbi:MAG: ATP-grasp domain-containing protein [Acidimicrobiales bacterium]